MCLLIVIRISANSFKLCKDPDLKSPVAITREIAGYISEEHGRNKIEKTPITKAILTVTRKANPNGRTRQDPFRLQECKHGVTKSSCHPPLLAPH